MKYCPQWLIGMCCLAALYPSSGSAQVPCRDMRYTINCDRHPDYGWIERGSAPRPSTAPAQRPGLAPAAPAGARQGPTVSEQWAASHTALLEEWSKRTGLPSHNAKLLARLAEERDEAQRQQFQRAAGGAMAEVPFVFAQFAQRAYQAGLGYWEQAQEAHFAGRAEESAKLARKAEMSLIMASGESIYLRQGDMYWNPASEAARGFLYSWWIQARDKTLMNSQVPAGLEVMMKRNETRFNTAPRPYHLARNEARLAELVKADAQRRPAAAQESPGPPTAAAKEPGS